MFTDKLMRAMVEAYEMGVTKAILADPTAVKLLGRVIVAANAVAESKDLDGGDDIVIELRNSLMAFKAHVAGMGVL